ncbi:MAG: hypothetical protein ACW972_12920 [Promethearchaeota archaeon]|jgi:hypothetical protein
MTKTFICRECGYEFPSELSNLIDSNIQVYCERCGSPFNLEGVKFKPAPTPVIRKFPLKVAFSERESSNLNKMIQFLNKISFLPLFFFTFISFGLIAEIAFNLDSWVFILFNRFLPGLIGLLLLVYDRAYIAPKIKENKYNEIFLDSLCWGILGSVLYGTGVIILIKGVFIFVYVLVNRENKNLKVYDYGLLAKNSINYFSSRAGFVIILIGIFTAFSNGIYIPTGATITISFPFSLEIPIILLIYFGLLIISSIALLIDRKSKNLIGSKQSFEIGYSIKIVIIGVLGVLFYAAGIFILLKGVLLFFLFVTKPSEKPEIDSKEEKPVYTQQIYRGNELPLTSETERKKELLKEPIGEPQPVKILPREKEPQVLKTAIEQKSEEKRELLEELAFLTKEEQVRYIEAIVDLYKEIPKKLIERIRKLPNVDPKHLDKIVEQLRVMDIEEQFKFVQFLEENA